MRIRTKILLPFTMLFLVTILIGISLSYVSANNAITNRVHAQLDSISVLKQNQIDHVIHHYIKDIEEAADKPYVQLLTLIYTNDTASSSFLSEEITQSELDFQYWNSHAEFKELFIINNEGLVIYSTDQKQIGKNKNNVPYFIQGQDQTYLQSYYFDISIQQQSMMISTPIVINESKVAGVLAGRLDLTKISDIMYERSGLGKTGETYLVNNINMIVTDVKYDTNYTFKKFIFSPGINKALEGKNNTGIYYNYMNNRVVGNYIKNPNLDSILVCEIGYNEAYAVLFSYIYSIGISMTIVFIILFIVMYVFSLHLSRPIEQLTSVTKTIGKQHNNPIFLPKSTNDEIGKLTTAFQDMIQDLNEAKIQIDEYNLQLENKIKQRTRDLQQSKTDLEHIVKQQKMTKIALLNMMNDLNQTIKDLEKAKTEIEKKNIDLNNTQRELERINKHLEDIVTERTEKINHLLHQKDEFVNQLGHDLKNPLGPLLNLIPLLEEKNKDPSLNGIFDVLNRNVNHMKNLVIKTIQLAQLNSSNTQLQYENIDLLDEIDGLIKKNNFLFTENNIEVENNINESIIVPADKLRIVELFDNIFNNAVKYNHNGGKITIDAVRNEDNIIISIMDTGIGMSKEQIEHIFDEFYKADWSRHDFDSSGLGMPIAKRIVEKHGGHIWVESDGIGKGSTFYFSLPIK